MNSNKSISILGCGWLGFEVAIAAVLQGYQVKGSTTTPSKIRQLKAYKIAPFLIDLSQEIEVSEFFNSDILILNIPPGRRDPEMRTNYPRRIEKALKAAKKGGISQVILVSSTGVYRSESAAAPDWSFPIYKDEDPNGEGDSAMALIHAEILLKEHFEENGTILRFGGLVGGSRLAGRFLAGKKEVSNGVAPVNMIHRDDCVRIILDIISKEAWGETFNATADHHPSRQHFYGLQAAKYGLEPPTFLHEREASGKIISNEKLRKRLDYQFSYPDPLQF